MRSEEVRFRLQARSPLHLLTLNTHGLALVFKLHCLKLLLSAKAKFLLTLHGINIERRLCFEPVLIERVLEIKVGQVYLMLREDALLLQILRHRFQFAIAPTIFVHTNIYNIQTTHVHTEELLNLGRNKALHQLTQFQYLSLQLHHLYLIVVRRIRYHAFDEFGELAFHLLLEDAVVHILRLIDFVEAVDIVHGINNRAMHGNRHPKVFEAGIKYVKIRDGKLHLASLCQVGKGGLLFAQQ